MKIYEHARQLETHIKKENLTRGAEVGVLRGATYFYLLDACPGLTLYGVDQWKALPKSKAPGAYSYDQYDMGLLQEQVTMRALAYGERARIMVGDSVRVANAIKNRSLDFVFIDADHTYEGVTGDIGAWAPKVRPGGWIMGHDITKGPVRRAVRSVFENYMTLPGTIWMVPQ